MGDQGLRAGVAVRLGAGVKTLCVGLADGDGSGVRVAVCVGVGERVAAAVATGYGIRVSNGVASEV